MQFPFFLFLSRILAQLSSFSFLSLEKCIQDFLEHHQQQQQQQQQHRQKEGENGFEWIQGH